jgi:hypothetical protein
MSGFLVVRLSIFFALLGFSLLAWFTLGLSRRVALRDLRLLSPLFPAAAPSASHRVLEHFTAFSRTFSTSACSPPVPFKSRLLSLCLIALLFVTIILLCCAAVTRSNFYQLIFLLTLNTFPRFIYIVSNYLMNAHVSNLKHKYVRELSSRQST